MRSQHRPVRRTVALSGTGITTSAPPGRRRVTRALVTTVPVVVPLTMRLVFPALARRLGTRRGYLAGFALYWAGGRRERIAGRPLLARPLTADPEQ
jgi:hypothetical protein